MNITDIKETAPDGESYDATINGTLWSGITSGSRFWTPLQEAIANGEPVTPYASQE